MASVGIKMTLPKWFDQPAHCVCTNRCDCDLKFIKYRQALAVAIEALKYVVHSGESYDRVQEMSESALAEINAIGDEAKPNIEKLGEQK